MTMSSALSNAIITRYHSSYKNSILAVYHAFLCEANTFIHIVFFNTFDKIGVFVRTINLFIHLASEFINDSFGFPNYTPVADVDCTNLVIDNKRPRNDQKKFLLNTFKNRNLPTILTTMSFQ